ncbi:hypothetical protein [Rhodococcus gannanensis]|uniref:Uncharacterized protein n=1 Tax=Rhodococcus gannanensis TaxID=1960308 RepID=A0ABW4P1A8_9NOCA
MAGKLVRGGVAALSAAAIVAGGAVVGTGTASAQSAEDFVSSASNGVYLSSEWTPEQWVAAGLFAALLTPLAVLDAVSSFDLVIGCPGFGGEQCVPVAIEQQLLNWVEGELGS